jgi:hypothetical protein
MNTNRYVMASAAAGIFFFFYGYVANVIVLGPIFADVIPSGIYREMGEEMVGVIFLACILQAFVLGYIFLKNYEAKGWQEGARFGFLIALFYGALALLNYAIIPIPFSAILGSVVGDGLGYVGLGIVLALVYKPA